LIPPSQREEESADESHDEDDSDTESEAEKILHPNFINHNHKAKKRVYKGCKKYFHRFDELIMRPIFIYKYEKNMVKQS